MMNGTKERGRIKDTYNIEDFIKEGKKKTITHYNSSILGSIENSDIEYPIQNVVYEYLDELNSLKTQYIMSNEEFNKYKMRPDLFCYDKYGTMDIEWVILAINNMMSPKDFSLQTIYYIDPTYISKIIGMITNAENDYILANRNNYKDGRF